MMALPAVRSMSDGRLRRGAHRLLHRHPHDELCLVGDPGTVIVHDGMARRAPPGTLFLFRRGEAHGFDSDGAPTRMWVVHFDPEPLIEADCPGLAAAPGHRIWALSGSERAEFIGLFERLQAEIDCHRPGWEHAAAAWLRLLLVAATRFGTAASAAASPRTAGGLDSDVLKLRREIDARRQGLAAGPLAEAVDNYDALRHRFRLAYGEAPTRMLARLRIGHARHLLIETDLPIAAIARQIGYARQHEFARAFHRAVGCTPSDFRRRSQAG